MSRSVAPLFVWACFAFCECSAALHVSCRVQTMCPLFVVSQQLFHSTSKVNFCRLLLNLKGKQTRCSSLITPVIPTQSYEGHLWNWPLLGVTLNIFGVQFLCGLSKRSSKRFISSLYSNQDFQEQISVKCWGFKRNPGWVSVTFKTLISLRRHTVTVVCVDYPFKATVSFTPNCLALIVFICQLSFYVRWITWGSCTFL